MTSLKTRQNTSMSAVRNEKGHWIKGAASPNPGGRPPGKFNELMRAIEREFGKGYDPVLRLLQCGERALAGNDYSSAVRAFDSAASRIHPVLKSSEVNQVGDKNREIVFVNVPDVAQAKTTYLIEGKLPDRPDDPDDAIVT